MPDPRAPIIGITCMDLRQEGAPARFAQNQSYALAVVRAGGCPILIPHLDDEAHLASLYRRCDGVLLPGGGDMEPALYHERVRTELRSVSPLRDTMEILLARWALDRDAPKPLLGICRGIQVLNVAVGGTLYQDLSQRKKPTVHHDTQGVERSFVAHEVLVEPTSRLHEIVGQRVLKTNSFHHQAIKRRAPLLSRSAAATDGVLEAVEVPDHPFAIAVQWHPEELAPIDEAAQRLFDAFVAACRS
ncbi:MAG TPA: gamma-glutamyl-gamma-aminobutyrate hydrolase family protein [Anaerolineae bacterium]|nr:gamma-glutamyl-gamma-aminobutyrate hydrolase family protein [Anaerolineae bacterium]